MTDAPPPEAPLPSAPEPEPEPAVRPPRKRFILIGLGIGLLIILIVGLTTSIGTSPSATSRPRGWAGADFHAPERRPDGLVPGLGTRRRRGERHAGRAALLRELVRELSPGAPPLAAAVRQQDKAGGALAKVRVIGVDSVDAPSTAKSFIKSAA